MAAGGDGGKAGGSAISQTLTVTPGEILTIVVGSGGPGSSILEGSDGTNTSIRARANVIVIAGGKGGAASAASSTTGNPGEASPYLTYGAGGDGGTVGANAGKDGTGGYVSITWG